MTKRNQTADKARKIVYWISTIWLALGMVSSGIVQLIKLKEEVDMFEHLGYPLYLLTLLGTWKMFGVVAIFLPFGRQVFPDVLKEWAYAGFFFAMSGAIFSHAASGDGTMDFFGPTLLLILTVVSWYLRPGSRAEATVQVRG